VSFVCACVCVCGVFESGCVWCVVCVCVWCVCVRVVCVCLCGFFFNIVLLHAPLREQYYMPYSNIYSIIYNL
jgi:hypothetical protein